MSTRRSYPWPPFTKSILHPPPTKNRATNTRHKAHVAGLWFLASAPSCFSGCDSARHARRTRCSSWSCCRCLCIGSCRGPGTTSALRTGARDPFIARMGPVFEARRGFWWGGRKGHGSENGHLHVVFERRPLKRDAPGYMGPANLPGGAKVFMPPVTQV